MSKRKIILKKLVTLIKLYKKIISLINQLLKADLRLSIYPGFLCGKMVWMRPMFPDDHLKLENCFTDPKNMQYFASGAVWSDKQITDNFHKCAFENLIEPNTYAWSIFSHNGTTGCFWLSRNKIAEAKKKKESEETAEIGFCLRPNLSGRGYTTEAGQLVIDSLESEFKGLIFATVHPKNIGSQKVLEKLDLKPDPEKQNVILEKYKAPRNYYQFPKRM